MSNFHKSACTSLLQRCFINLMSKYSIFLVLTGDTEYSLLDTPRKQYIFAARGYSIDLNCQLNNPLVDVHLMQEKKVTGSTKTIERVPDGVKVTQSGQIFTINNVKASDAGKYYCKVQSTFLRIETIIAVNFGSTQGNLL